MYRLITTFIVLTEILNLVSPDPAMIPTKEEQANLLKNVEEIFNQIKSLVNDEGGATDAAVVGDVQKMVTRASGQLTLLEDYALLKSACEHREASLESKIRQTIGEGQDFLHGCIEMASDDIMNNSQAVTTTTGEALNQGQTLLDTLNRCSKRPGLQQISCYKKVITHDVFPLKLILLDAIKMHKSGHLEAISIRKRANECVDYVLKTYRARVTQIFTRKRNGDASNSE